MESWQTNCEYLAKQDIIITAHEEEIVFLCRQGAELEAQLSRECDPHPITQH